MVWADHSRAVMPKTAILFLARAGPIMIDPPGRPGANRDPPNHPDTIKGAFTLGPNLTLA
jgi:hypothetical protein